MAESKREERRRKRRKGNAAGRPTSYSQLYKDDNSMEMAGGAANSDGAAASAALSGKGSESIDWQGEYRYVLRDLRWLLLVSLLIFAVMIGAGYLL